MIDLSHSIPFASGSNRHCFRHPADPLRCLKVTRPENIEARFQRQTRLKKVLGKERLNDNRQEQAAHNQSAIRNLLANGEEELVWAHLPRFYGVCSTSLGPANESQLILASNGEPAPTLETFLQQHGFDQRAQNAVTVFCEWLIRTGILTRNLLPHNLVVADQDGELTLFLVDGLGAPTIPQALGFFPAWRTRYISRRIRRFYLRIKWEAGGRLESWETSQKL